MRSAYGVCIKREVSLRVLALVCGSFREEAH